MSFLSINWQATELEDKLPLIWPYCTILKPMDLNTATSMVKHAFWSSTVLV